MSTATLNPDILRCLTLIEMRAGDARKLAALAEQFAKRAAQASPVVLARIAGHNHNGQQVAQVQEPEAAQLQQAADQHRANAGAAIIDVLNLANELAQCGKATTPAPADETD